MADTLKRQRDIEEEDTNSKRHKNYSQIISLLEEDEEEPNQDFSSLMTTLEQEISCEPFTTTFTSASESDWENPTARTSVSTMSNDYNSKDEEDEKERVMRHLLEASDDELGIPNRVDDGEVENETNPVDTFSLSMADGFWELEDEAANYYTLLQSELFL